MIKIYNSRTVPDELLMLYKVSKFSNNYSEFELYGFIDVTEVINKTITSDFYIDFKDDKYLPIGYNSLRSILGLSISFYRAGGNVFLTLDTFFRAHLEHAI